MAYNKSTGMDTEENYLLGGDPVVELTAKMVQTLEHINSFIRRLEEEDHQDEAYQAHSSPGEGGALDWDPRAELSKESHEALTGSNSSELVEKEDGPSEKLQRGTTTSGKSKVTFADKSTITDSLEKLQEQVNNTLKLQQVNHEISLLLNRVILCLNKRAMRKLQQETVSAQVAREKHPEILDSVDPDSSGSNITEQFALDRGDDEEQSVQDNEEEDEGVEKGDTEKSEGEIEDFSSADGGESFTTNTTDEEDLSSQASSVGEDLSGPESLNLLNIFKEHLHSDGIDIQFQQLSNKAHNHRHRYSFKGTLLGITVEGTGPSKRMAKKKATTHLIQEVIKRQKDGSLPPEFTPFTNQELQDLAPLQCKQQDNFVRLLQQHCTKLKIPHPNFAMISKPDPSKAPDVFTVQCSALSFTAVGTGLTKRAARREAAKEVMELVEIEEKTSR